MSQFGLWVWAIYFCLPLHILQFGHIRAEDIWGVGVGVPFNSGTSDGVVDELQFNSGFLFSRCSHIADCGGSGGRQLEKCAVIVKTKDTKTTTTTTTARKRSECLNGGRQIVIQKLRSGTKLKCGCRSTTVGSAALRGVDLPVLH